MSQALPRYVMSATPPANAPPDAEAAVNALVSQLEASDASLRPGVHRPAVAQRVIPVAQAAYDAATATYDQKVPRARDDHG